MFSGTLVEVVALPNVGDELLDPEPQPKSTDRSITPAVETPFPCAA